MVGRSPIIDDILWRKRGVARRGRHRGCSYYAGLGLNHSDVSHESVHDHKLREIGIHDKLFPAHLRSEAMDNRRCAVGVELLAHAQRAVAMPRVVADATGKVRSETLLFFCLSTQVRAAGT